jgi:hypothetical protein
MIAAWVFGGITLVFLMVVYFLDRGGSASNPIVKLVAAIFAGLMGFFLTGSIKLVTDGKIHTWGKISIQAGGGAAFFVLIWLTWPTQPVVPVKKVAEDAAVATLRELLADPKKMEELAKAAAGRNSVDSPNFQEMLAMKLRLESSLDRIEHYAQTAQVPADIREQLPFARETLTKYSYALMSQFVMGLRMILDDGTPLDSPVQETGLLPVEDLQIRLLLPKARLKEELPKDFWKWSQELRSSWIAEASDFVSLLNLQKVTGSPEGIMCFEKPPAGSDVINAGHLDGSLSAYHKETLKNLVKQQTGVWHEEWDKKILFDSK